MMTALTNWTIRWQIYSNLSYPHLLHLELPLKLFF